MPEPTFAYIKVDFESQKAALIQRVRSRFPGVWNDFSQGSFGTLILDVMAWSLSTTAYTQNRLAAENYLSTMSLRESVIRFAYPYGYVLRGATPATVPCQATLAIAVSSDVELLKGTPVRSGDPAALTFELSQDYTIDAGELTPLSTVATFDPALAGTANITALVSVTADSPYIDCLDTSVDLRALVQVGQLFRTEDGAQEYSIISVESAPGATSFNRMVVGTPWGSATTTTTGEVVDRRVVFVQGQTQSEQFTAPLDASAYTVRLAYSSVVNDSVEVAVNGVTWSEVASLVYAAPTEQAFEVRLLATGETVVIFGDGLFGAAPAAQATVAITYRTGGGVAGNIVSGLITASITGQITNLASPVTVTVSNEQPGSGGLPAQSLDEARTRIPAFIRTNDRAVTLEDYQTLAIEFASAAGQVRFARATVRTQNSLLEGNVVVLYAWTTGPENALVPLSVGLKTALQAYLQTKAVGTDYVLVADGEATEFPLSCRFKATPGYDVATVEDAVLAATSAFVTALAPGATAGYSQLVLTLAAVPGVLAVTVAVPDDDVRPASDSTVFSPPAARPFYLVEVASVGGGACTGQAPSAPLAAWGITARLNGENLTVTPDTIPGFARLTGTALSTDEDEISTINLQTGLISFFTSGPVGTFELGFVSVQGYNRDRIVDLYAGYTGDLSLAKRREIRTALRVWGAGIPVAAPLFADEIVGAPASVVSARAVIEAVEGVVGVTRVSFDAPTNLSNRLDVGEYELASLRNIYLNNFID